MRLTNRKTCSDLKNNAERLKAKGMEVSISDLMYIKLAEYENAEEDVDVQPVKHSRWIPMNDGTFNAYCENCGQERGSKAWNKNDFKYCFGCGARMDGDTNG